MLKSGIYCYQYVSSSLWKFISTFAGNNPVNVYLFKISKKFLLWENASSFSIVKLDRKQMSYTAWCNLYFSLETSKQHLKFGSNYTSYPDVIFQSFWGFFLILKNFFSSSYSVILLIAVMLAQRSLLFISHSAHGA